jgi:iron complex transport system ATP-binding protein
MLMRDGALVATGRPSDVLTAEALHAVYGVVVSIERLASGQTVCAPGYG